MNFVYLKGIIKKLPYLKDLGVNSIGLVYFSIAIEETFKIDMSDVTFNTFKNVQDVIDYIKGRL